MKTALLIATYNWPDALDMVLKTVAGQQRLPDEILIADDGSDDRTAKVIDGWKKRIKVPVRHFWHEDNGFRKTIILNEAISHTDAEYIIQIDGDILLEENFIKDHINAAKKGFYIKGSRALISPKNTTQILSSGTFNVQRESKRAKNKINATRSPILAPIFRKDTFKSNNLRGCNFSFWRADFIAVNGYNNDFQGWGHEDIELAARLTNYGIKQRQLKMVAVCFHLHHKINSRKNEEINYNKYLEVVEKKIIKCENGYA